VLSTDAVVIQISSGYRFIVPQLKRNNTVNFTLLFKRNKKITDFKTELLNGSHQPQTYCRSGMDKLEPWGPPSSPDQTWTLVNFFIYFINWCCLHWTQCSDSTNL